MSTQDYKDCITQPNLTPFDDFYKISNPICRPSEDDREFEFAGIGPDGKPICKPIHKDTELDGYIEDAKNDIYRELLGKFYISGYDTILNKIYRFVVCNGTDSVVCNGDMKTDANIIINAEYDNILYAAFISTDDLVHIIESKYLMSDRVNESKIDPLTNPSPYKDISIKWLLSAEIDSMDSNTLLTIYAKLKRLLLKEKENIMLKCILATAAINEHAVKNYAKADKTTVPNPNIPVYNTGAMGYNQMPQYSSFYTTTTNKNF